MKMATKNFNRQNEDIARMLATLIRNVKDPRVNQGLLSITAVETTGDLRYSNVYLSVLGLKSEKELMKGLKSASGYLRHELGSALELRYTPELIFHLDKSIEHGAMINKILSGLDVETDKADTDEGEDEDTDE
jgi:ribosome-binding factor A